MKIIKYVLLLIAVLGVAAYASKPSDEECISLGKEFVGKYLAPITKDSSGTRASNLSPTDTTGIVTVEDNYFFKSIYYTEKEKTIQIGCGSFGRVKLSYSTLHEKVAGHAETIHPMLIIFSL